jgi:hypothetical protein
MGHRLLGLYQFPKEEQHRFRNLVKSVQTLVRRAQGKFVFFVGLSLCIHLLVFGVLFIRNNSQASGAGAQAQSNERAISKAMMEIANRTGLQTPSGKGVSPEKMEAMARYLGEFVTVDPSITEKEKTEIFRDLMQLYSGLVQKEDRAIPFDPQIMSRLAALLKQERSLKLDSGDTIVVAKSSPGGQYEISKVAKTSLDKLKRLEEEAKSGRVGARSVNGMVQASATNGPKFIPEEYYFKKSPYQEMMAKGARLFAVFKGFPVLSMKPSKGGLRDEPRTQEMVPRSTLSTPGFVYLVSKRPSQIEKPEGAVLNLSDNERSRILDELMALKESEQLDAFKKRYLDRYDLDQEDLAKLTREFLFSNMNGIIVMTDRIGSAFDFIEEVYFKRPVYDFFASYTCRFPKSRTGIELLFFLTSSYDFERRALENLLLSHMEGVVEGGKEDSGIYQPRMKAFVLNQVYQDINVLSKRIDVPLESLLDQYTRHQEEIYGMLVELGGETRNRALYAWGKHYWDQEKFELAVEKWKQVDTSFPVPSSAYWQIMGFVTRFGLGNSVHEIDNVLREGSASDRQDLLERHLKFHTWKNRQSSQ